MFTWFISQFGCHPKGIHRGGGGGGGGGIGGAGVGPYRTMAETNP